MSFPLFVYRLAWEPALLLARGLARLEPLLGKFSRASRWRVRERLGQDAQDEGNIDVTQSAPAAVVPSIWMHGASLGESKGVWAVAQALAAEIPAVNFVLTTNTVEGRDFLAHRIRERTELREKSGATFCVYLAPLDHPRIVRSFIRKHDARALLLFEVELWPHFMREMRRAGGPVLRISALEVQGGLAARLLKGVDWTHAQSGPGGADLRGLYYLRTQGSGESSAPSQDTADSAREGLALVSLHADELPALLPALQSLRGDFPVYVFPRRLQELSTFEKTLGPLGFERRSRNPRAALQLVDAFGLVEEILPGCRAAVVGGSFAPHGGHNLWEPMTAGLTLAIGPHHESQRYLVDKLRAAGLLRVYSPDSSRSGMGPSLDLNDLHAGEPPVVALKRFVETERELLRAAVHAIGAQIEPRFRRPSV